MVEFSGSVAGIVFGDTRVILVTISHLCLQYIKSGNLVPVILFCIGKDPDAGRDWGQEEKGTTEDGMAGWHHQLDGHGFE